MREVLLLSNYAKENHMKCQSCNHISMAYLHRKTVYRLKSVNSKKQPVVISLRTHVKFFRCCGMVGLFHATAHAYVSTPYTYVCPSIVTSVCHTRLSERSNISRKCFHYGSSITVAFPHQNAGRKTIYRPICRFRKQVNRCGCSSDIFG